MEQDIPVADAYEDVFLLASDIAGFTKLSARLPPSEVVALLSRATS